MFGKKRKQEDIKAGILGEGVPIPPPEAVEKQPEKEPEKPKLTPEQLQKIEEIKEHIAYFDENYGQIDFGENLGGLKQLLFGILVELKKLNDSQDESK